MTDANARSDRSVDLARRDRQALLDILDVAHDMGAMPAGSRSTDDLVPGGAQEDGFDAALDLPLGVESVGSRPRGLDIRETDPPNDVLPKGIVVQSAVREVAAAADELGFPIYGIGYWIGTQRFGDSPAHFSDHPTNPPTETPPFISVDLTGGDSRSEIASSLVQAVMEAARAPRHPVSLLWQHVDEEREVRWLEIRDGGRRINGLCERLEAAAGAARSEHMGRWFCEMAHPVHLEAFDSGVPVHISGTASAESGFQVTWHIGTSPDGAPWINLTAAAYKLDETIRHVINLILFAHAVDPHSDEGQHLARHMWAAAVARLTAVPEAPPF